MKPMFKVLRTLMEALHFTPPKPQPKTQKPKVLIENTVSQTTPASEELSGLYLGGNDDVEFRGLDFFGL